MDTNKRTILRSDRTMITVLQYLAVLLLIIYYNGASAQAPAGSDAQVAPVASQTDGTVKNTTSTRPSRNAVARTEERTTTAATQRRDEEGSLTQQPRARSKN